MVPYSSNVKFLAKHLASISIVNLSALQCFQPNMLHGHAHKIENNKIKSLKPLLFSPRSLFIKDQGESNVLDHVYIYSVIRLCMNNCQAYCWWWGTLVSCYKEGFMCVSGCS